MTPKIKPLIWEANSEWHHVCTNNIFGECWIKHYGDGLWTLYDPGHYGVGNHFKTLDDAKTAAFVHVEQKILSVIGADDQWKYKYHELLNIKLQSGWNANAAVEGYDRALKDVSDYYKNRAVYWGSLSNDSLEAEYEHEAKLILAMDNPYEKYIDDR